MEPDRYAEENELLDRFLSSNKLTEQEAWDRLIGELYEARDLEAREFESQVDPLNEGEVLLDLAKFPPRLGFQRLLFEAPDLDLKTLLVDRTDPLLVLPYLHLLVAPLLPVADCRDWGPPALTLANPPPKG
ncbi:MAG: hypothetical protein INH43_03385 [Acidobacteriaceae bacterium]|jgi:hypothetical protein|nr:hypothetical protein [Acidobacteriaceae bacterium]